MDMILNTKGGYYKMDTSVKFNIKYRKVTTVEFTVKDIVDDFFSHGNYAYQLKVEKVDGGFSVSLPYDYRFKDKLRTLICIIKDLKFTIKVSENYHVYKMHVDFSTVEDSYNLAQNLSDDFELEVGSSDSKAINDYFNRYFFYVLHNDSEGYRYTTNYIRNFLEGNSNE